MSLQVWAIMHANYEVKEFIDLISQKKTESLVNSFENYYTTMFVMDKVRQESACPIQVIPSKRSSIDQAVGSESEFFSSISSPSEVFTDSKINFSNT